MPTERIAICRVREMLRLTRDAAMTGRFERSGLAWPSLACPGHRPWT
jgi:hypothetical protein